MLWINHRTYFINGKTDVVKWKVKERPWGEQKIITKKFRKTYENRKRYRKYYEKTSRRTRISQKSKSSDAARS